jgi:hypothetical protein
MTSTSGNRRGLHDGTAHLHALQSFSQSVTCTNCAQGSVQDRRLYGNTVQRLWSLLTQHTTMHNR